MIVTVARTGANLFLIAFFVVTIEPVLQMI